MYARSAISGSLTRKQPNYARFCATPKEHARYNRKQSTSLRSKSLRNRSSICSFHDWWTGRDSDPRPSGGLVNNLQTGRSSAQLSCGIPG
jgi:hypothetical protein